MRRLLAMSAVLIATVAAVSQADEIPATPDAVRNYNEALAQARALQEQARKAVERKDYDLAITDFSNAIELKPDDVDLYTARAAAYRAINEHGKAAEDVKAIIGIYNKLEAEFSEQIRLSPKDHYAYFRRSLLHAGKARLSATKQQQSEFEMAVADITAAIQRQPKHADYYGYRAAYHHGLGNNAEAERDQAAFEKLMKDK